MLGWWWYIWNQRELRRRYDQIRSNISIDQARVTLAAIGNAAFQRLVMRLDALDVVVGAECLMPAHVARCHPRLGLTLALPGRKPMIWLNLAKHRDDASLIDTVAHESIHATIIMLGRSRQTPQPDSTINYHAEEIVALSGANWILKEIAFPAKREMALNRAAILQLRPTLVGLGCTEQFIQEKVEQGVRAGKFLLDS